MSGNKQYDKDGQPINETAADIMGFEIVKKSLRVPNDKDDLLVQYREAVQAGNIPKYFVLPSKIRKLRGEYTLELMEDLKAVSRSNAEKEILEIIEQELSGNS